MSTQAVNQFLQKVTEDPQLQEELTLALEAKNDRQAATDLAAKHGYQFTPDELWAEVQNRQSEFQQKEDAGQLNDEELETVAGGVGGTPLAAMNSGMTLVFCAKPKKGQW